MALRSCPCCGPPVSTPPDNRLRMPQRNLHRISAAALIASAAALIPAHADTDASQAGALVSKFDAFPAELRDKIHYVIILYPENRSFDSLYGQFPGAEGIAQADPTHTLQVDRTGKPLPFLSHFNTNGMPGISNGPDPRFPIRLPNAPFDISTFVPDGYQHGDLTHKFYTEQYMINSKADRFRDDPNNLGGAPMSKFSTWSSNPGLTMGHYDEHAGGEGLVAHEFVLCDHAHHSAFGGSFLNHQWLISARTPVWTQHANPNGEPPVSYITKFTNGFPSISLTAPLSDAVLSNEAALPEFKYSNAHRKLESNDYWAINTVSPINGPSDLFSTAETGPRNPVKRVPPASLLPLQTHDTIGDRLSAGNITWAWYSGGWADAKAGRGSYMFQPHHQPFAYFAKYALAKPPTVQTPGSGSSYVPAKQAEDSPGSAAHLKDEDADFYPALAAGTLPHVCFVKPIGANNSHPGYASVRAGQDWVARTMEKIKQSPIWPECAVFVMYDEHGGLWDHVQPPQVDRWGPGLRVPLIVASPFSKNCFVDHSQYETVSLLAFIEQLFQVPPLNEHDANALPPVAAFKGSPDLIIQATAGKELRSRIPVLTAPCSFAWSGDKLPGLEINSASGEISGTPATAGKYAGKVSVQSAHGTQELQVLIDVTPAS